MNLVDVRILAAALNEMENQLRAKGFGGRMSRQARVAIEAAWSVMPAENERELRARRSRHETDRGQGVVEGGVDRPSSQALAVKERESLAAHVSGLDPCARKEDER